ncbi:hypothetical protein ACH5RR_039798 [Cinchona calisaya]|uniref:Ribulose bisphosphate carboxylase large subunit C-terminal domain-containing protein n=1 Tax=Cinchona calisaya TaxID=153742 RepID=A0ABD2Y1W7_9GENT
MKSQPFLHWRDHFLFCAKAICKAHAEIGEIKGHYLNATAGGLTANTILAHYCRDNGLLLHIHCAMHAVIDRLKNHGMHFRVLGKVLCLSGGDHIHVVVVFISLKIGSIYQVFCLASGGAIVNRVAHNEGRYLAAEGNEIIREASKWSPELAAACEVWKAIRFNFKAVDTLDPS